jgi:hypothetical protein
MSCCGQKRRALNQSALNQPRPPAPAAPQRVPAQARADAALLAFLARRNRTGQVSPPRATGQPR